MSETMDVKNFDIAEAYKLAITVEEEGYKFYDDIVKNTENVRVKNELTYLRDEEQKHKAFFLKCLEKVKSSGDTPGNKELRAWIEKEVLGPVKEFYKTSGPSNNNEALRVGAVVEKKTIAFFEALKKVVMDKDAVKDLETILEEETKHLKRINILLAY